MTDKLFEYVFDSGHKCDNYVQDCQAMLEHWVCDFAHSLISQITSS